MRTPASSVLRGLLPLLALLALGGAPGAAAEPEGPGVALRTLSLARVEGTLVGLDAETLTLHSPLASGPRSFRLDEVIELEFGGRAADPVGAPRFRTHLVGGSRLLGRYAGSLRDGLRLEVAGLGTLELLFEQVLTMEAWPADATPCRDVAGRHPRPESDDVAFDRKDDQVRGIVLEAAGDALVLETERGRKRSVAWNELQLLYLENDRLEAPKGLLTEVELADGSRLAAAKLALGEKGLQVTLRELPGTQISVPYERVQSVRWRGGRFVYASELPFESTRRHYNEDPEGLLDPADLDRFLGTRVDRRPSGCPLRVGGETFRHGFGVNSHSTITIPLDGAYASFRTSFGIDDEVLERESDDGSRGNVDARVLADGKVLWEAKGVKGGEKVRRVGPLDVKGAKTLVLEVGFGGDYFSLDRADWGDPILVKKSAD